MTAKTCIICGGGAGSHEHVFPAALGGRRTNKGIYCTPHNNGFGRHVAELQKQLLMFNAILKVRPDRHDAPRAFSFSDKNGDHFSMLGPSIETAAPPSINDLGLSSGETAALKFNSKEQFEGWKETQRKNGWDVQVSGDFGEPQQRLFAAPVSVSLRFGGHAGLQAVGYLALTFFAQYFPDVARSAGLEPFKNFLALDFSKEEDEAKWKSNLVWWDGRNADDVVGKGPFRFGHTIVVGVSTTKKRAYAYISFFSSLNFGVDLGPVDDPRERMVRVFIDPRAEKAPDDLDAVDSDAFSIEVDPAASDLLEMIQSGTAELAVKKFLHEVGAWHFESFVSELDEELQGWAKSHSTDSTQFAATLVQKHRQRVLNVVSFVASGLKVEFEKNGNIPTALPEMMDKLIEADDHQSNGLSQHTNALLELSRSAITDVIKRELDSKKCDAGKIAGLLGGTQGVTVITQQVIQPLLLSSLK
ncbi:HNH endonuclease [Burkholderia sp. Ax-1719]|uniref:HNH endonuclease n=1 Tax=Burkholderia sp. Ax-1719 TaxID=2608334 RepID=UPI001422CD1B|nr:HNH endonuclease [Burkholderia sp. Ax-1719]NIE63198.1 HNH endonuclease [Burkholderia sp. Ax-1719]